MAVRATQEVLLISVRGTGFLRTTQEVLLISTPYILAPVAITYPLTPPAIAGLGPQDFSMTEDNVVGESESPFTLSQQEYQWPGTRFQIEANMPPMVMTEAEQWMGFLGSLKGKYGTCLMPDYLRPTPQGPMSGSPLVAGTNLNGSGVLNIRGAAASVTNWGVAGDYIQITSGSGAPQRLYKLLQNASTDGSGDAALEIFPNIRETLSDGTAIVTANCAGTFRMVKNSFTWKVDRNKMYAISFQMKEAI